MPRSCKRIQSDYVTDPNITDVTTGALHGLLESLDADSSYLTPTEYKIYKDGPPPASPRLASRSQSALATPPSST